MCVVFRKPNDSEKPLEEEIQDCLTWLTYSGTAHEKNQNLGLLLLNSTVVIWPYKLPDYSGENILVRHAATAGR